MKILKNKKMSYLSLLKWMVENLDENQELSNMQIKDCIFYHTKTFKPVINLSTNALMGIRLGDRCGFTNVVFE